MLKKVGIAFAVFLTITAGIVIAHTDDTVRSRLKITWPDQGHEGGTTLFNKHTAAIEKIADNLNSRYEEFSAIADSTTVEHDHNFGMALTELTVLIYTGSGSNLTRVQDPVAAGWAYNAKVGSEKTILEVDTPSSGGPHTFAVVVINGSAVESIDDLDDVDISTTAPEEGQALVWDSGGSEFIPGASGDSSLKLQDVSGTDLTIKAGHIILSDGRELRLSADLTYDLSGYTTNDDYYVYIDTTLLPASTTSVNGREVYDLTSGMIILDATLPTVIDLFRYVPIGTIQRSAGTWQNQATLAVRRHDTLVGTNSSVVFTENAPTIGEVGIVDNTQGDLEASFLTGTYSFFNLEDDQDDSGNGRHLSNGTVDPDFTGQGIFKIDNKAAVFDGSTQYLQSNNSFYDFGNNTDFTVGVWVKTNQWDAGSDVTIFAGATSATDRAYGIWIEASGNLASKISTNGTSWNTYVQIDCSGFDSDKWYFVAMTYDFSATTQRLYVDGHLVAENTSISNTANLSADLFTLGARYATEEQFFKGELDELFAVSGTAYTSDQLLGLYSRRFNGEQYQAGHIIDSSSYPTHGTTAFFNLVSDGDNGEGTAAYDLTPQNTPDFTAKGILGSDNEAVYLDNASSEYLNNTTSSHFSPGDKPHSIAGWFSANDWFTTTQRTLFANWGGATAGYAMYLDDSYLHLDIAGSGGTTSYLHPVDGWNGWYHIAMIYDAGSYKIYINGVPSFTLAPSGTLNTPSNNFNLGGYNGGATFDGSIDEFIFNNGYAFTQSDIDKLYSRKLTHSKNLQTDLQAWEGQVSYDGMIRPFNDFVIDKSLDDLYFDLSGQNSMSAFDFSLKSNSTVGYSIATRGYERRMTATELDTALPITHGVSGRPTHMELWVETTTSGQWEQHDPASYIVASDTQLISTGTTLASVVGGSTNVHLIASKGSSAVSAPAASATDNGIVTTSTQTFAGDKTFTGTITAEGSTVNETPWFIDANIGGANIDLGSSNQATYVTMADAGLDLVKNTNSANVGIACESMENTVGTLTCSSGSENIGVVFDAPSIGHYKACVEFSWSIGLVAGDYNITTFQLAHSSNSTTAWASIVEEGKSRVMAQVQQGTGTNNADIHAYPFNICGTFNFTTTGKKTIRLYREQLISGTPTGNDIMGDRNTSAGQRDIHFTVYKIF